MKILKVVDEKENVTRKLIVNFGETIYQASEVCSVTIKVNFKDGSSVGFRRNEDEDELESFLKDIEVDEENKDLED